MTNLSLLDDLAKGKVGGKERGRQMSSWMKSTLRDPASRKKCAPLEELK